SGGLDELTAFERERLATHDARGREPTDGADDQEKTDEVSATEERRENDHQKQIRKRVQHIDEAHHQIVGASARVTCDRPPRESYYQADGGREQPDEERDAHAIECAYEQIAAEPVGPEPM